MHITPLPLKRSTRLVLSALGLATFVLPRLAGDPLDFVDPTIGGIGHVLEPTRPTVSLPNSMVRVYPVRRDATDDQIHSFPLTIISHRLGELFWLMPCAPESVPDGWTHPAAYDQEKVTPYSYSARLEESGIGIEFTPTAQCGYFRFTSPHGAPAILLANRIAGTLTVESRSAVSGVERFQGIAAYFYGEFSAPCETSGEATNRGRQLAVRFSSRPSAVEFRYGISFISVDQARRNLAGQIPTWDFAAVREHARQRWAKALGQIEVAGGSEAQKRVFYTSLYRCYERMVCITEDGRYYSASDHSVHEDPRPFYVDNWIWDLYQAHEPLMELLHPAMEADEIQSYVRMSQQSGAMPSFAVLWGDYPCMTGNHAAAWMADAWFKGIRNFDLPAAYAGLRKNSVDATILPWLNGAKTPLDDFFNAHGYLPALRPGEKETEPRINPLELRQAVSVTLANSFDDYCIAQLADQLGRASDRQLFLRRAAFYRNVFRPDRGMMWPKDAAGQWIEPYDPKFPTGRGGRDYFTENNGYTYDWDVKHDLQGLFDLMGGRASTEAKLDQLFREELGTSKYEFFYRFPDSTGMVGQFSMGNEPSFPIPYLYDFLGAPWKTQKRIRMLMNTWFTDTLLGIPGDEDGGGMTSFAVFSLLGFYPVVPGTPAYCFGSPAFDRVTIHLENGQTIGVVCRNNSPENKYIQSVQLNGRQLDRIWFRHADIANGATLELTMGGRPNRELGSDPKTFPPSAIDFEPKTLAP